MTTPVYVQQGVAYSDSFVYELATGVFQTGKVQANFTIRLSANGVGNQATTGVTITEVDAVNNPGVYQIAVSTAGFIATNGSYEILIFDTTSPLYSWEQVIFVTGTGAPGSTSTVSFTSVSGNGRAVDSSGAALAGVTVYIKTGASFLTVLTTDANGNFGPFYAAAGTYSLYYQKSGYSQGTASIVFTTSAATGPLIDITLTAVSTGATVLAGDLWTYCRQQSFDQTGSTADLRIKRAVNKAMDMVARARVFNWWLRRDFLTIYGAITYNVTLTKGSAVATSTSGNFATWAGTAKLKLNSQIVDCIALPSAAVVTLKQAWNGASGSYSATLFQDTYALPVNCYQFGRVLPGQQWGWGGEPVSAEMVWEAENAANYGQAFPGVFAVANGSLIMFPYPSTDCTLLYTYHARPAPLAASTDLADFDSTQIELVHRAIDYQTALEFGKTVAGDAPACSKAFNLALAGMTKSDRLTADLPGLSGPTGMYGRDVPQWKSKRSY